MKKLILSAMAALTMGLTAHAVPAFPGQLNFGQSDGTTISVRLIGDEWFSTYTTLDGYTIEADSRGDFYYKQGNTRSSIKAHNLEARSAAEQSYVAAHAAEMHIDNVVQEQLSKKAPNRVKTMALSRGIPCKGSPRVPVILVEFSDLSMRTSNAVEAFDNMLNTKEKSALQYFTDQSYGQFTPQFDILGPVTLDKPRAYYGAHAGTANDAKPGSMAAEAVMALTDVDFSQYDNDHNGDVDVVMIMYAGPGENHGASRDAIWPHQWYIRNAYSDGRSDYMMFKQNGVNINRYACFCETAGGSDTGTTLNGIGTFCHEFSHVMGLPDFYETTYAHGYYGMGYWSLMDNGGYLGGGNTPSGYTAYERAEMGWIEIQEAESNKQYTIKPIDLAEGEAVRIYNPEDRNEYYIFENHQKQGWNASQATSGLLINHVTYDAIAWDYNTVNNSMPQLMTIAAADCLPSKYTESGDLFPYNGKTEFSSTSSPASRLNRGTAGMLDMPVTEITQNSDGTISFWVQKGYVKETASLTASNDDITTSSFGLTWDAVENALYYTVDVTGPNFQCTFDSISSPGLTVDRLSPGSTYSCTIRVTYTDKSKSKQSEELMVTTKDIPVLRETTPDQTGSRSFTACWNEMADVESYTLHVCRTAAMGYTQLLHETFDKSKEKGTTEVIRYINNYTDVSGWSGKWVYPAEGGLTISPSNNNGYITTPALNMGAHGGKIVVKFTAGCFNKQTNVPLTVSAGGDSLTIILPDVHQQEHTVVLNTDGSARGKVTFEVEKDKKLTITDVEIYSGDAEGSDVMVNASPLKAPSKTGNQDELYITGITSTQYLVTNLMNGAEYQYHVKALFANGCESPWSLAGSVKLNEATVYGDVTGDGVTDVNDINAVLSVILGFTSPNAFGDRADVSGNGVVDIIDLNTIVMYIIKKE